MTAPTMERSLAPASDVGKAIVSRVIGSGLGSVDQEDLDQQMRHRVRVTTDRVDVLVGELQCLVAQ